MVSGFSIKALILKTAALMASSQESPRLCRSRGRTANIPGGPNLERTAQALLKIIKRFFLSQSPKPLFNILICRSDGLWGNLAFKCVKCHHNVSAKQVSGEEKLPI